MKEGKSLENQAINTIRFLSADAIQQANSGHPGLPMGTAALTYALWTRHLIHNPANPDWANRDRFILSGGHGSMLLYSLLHLTGYDLSLEEIKNFRQWQSLTPGHPEYGVTPGVETTTGPLGQGFANGIGFAIAEAHLAAIYNRPDFPIIDHYTYGLVTDGDLMEGVVAEAAIYNRPDFPIIDHYTYGLVTDGDLMEGVVAEAASLAGHLQLGKVIYLYDDNRISIDGSTDLAFTEDRGARFEAYGWQVLKVDDGNDVEAVDLAIQNAKKDSRPSLIICRTHIGFGLPTKQDTAAAHGSPPGDEELDAAKKAQNWPIEPRFYIPEEVLDSFRQALGKGGESENHWNDLFNSYSVEYPAEAAELKRRLAGNLPENWENSIPEFPADAKGMATRAASGKVLNSIAAVVPELMGGSADLAPSTKTWLEGIPDFQVGQYQGRNFHFGVREHGMGAVINGMAYHGGIIPYGGTFLVFSDYMRPASRVSGFIRMTA